MIISLYSSTQQSGKSTVASYLDSKYGFVPIKFAASLYLMAYALARSLFDEREAYRLVYESKEELWPVLNVSTRTLLRTLGTEWGRNTISESIWADIARHHIERFREYDYDLIFDDNRFENEIDMLREFDTKFVRIIRPDAHIDRSHRSEGLLDDFEFDYTIVNGGSIEYLYDQIDAMMEVFANGQ